ncbi:Short repeat of unknown function [Pseudobutyrivibrio sp. YE44]|uniref:DUF308 domain-containing protein n=1 Tax=Pseudobutyrivibrio sp. YE44 TaxID=1520802 RepID=UPI00088AB4FA|nr:DUF308 domain-containing protein [Pseudobutyrivibrio sp. YE44]SDB10169.1 Short repeat of unknown function [Pseudobutyrivibrio sp. YE44]
MTKTNNEEIKDSKVALVAHVVTSIAMLALGICMLVLDTKFIASLVYSYSVLSVGILFICFGAWYMIKYFFHHEYIRITNYGFTMGVILVIIGALSIFNANMVSGFIDGLVCLIGIVLGAIMLQQSFALFHIQKVSWLFCLVFGGATIAASVYFFLFPIKFFEGSLVGCIYLIGAGALAILSLLLMVIGLGSHKKDANRNYNRNVEDSPMGQTVAGESIFEDEPVYENYSSNATSDSDSYFED